MLTSVRRLMFLRRVGKNLEEKVASWSRKRRKLKGNKLPPFVPLTWQVLNSAAYKALPHSAGKALPYFLGKVKLPYRDPRKNSTAFAFSYTEAKKYGFANATFHRVICELMSKGFIDPVDRGGLRGGGLSNSLFKLSDRWMKYGTQDFEEIEDWRKFFPQFKNQKQPQKWNAATSKTEQNQLRG